MNRKVPVHFVYTDLVYQSDHNNHIDPELKSAILMNDDFFSLLIITLNLKVMRDVKCESKTTVTLYNEKFLDKTKHFSCSFPSNSQHCYWYWRYYYYK